MFIIKNISLGLIKCELCCYGDFLRPLGVRPKLEYLLDNTNLELQKWREKLKYNLKFCFIFLIKNLEESWQGVM